MWSSCDPFPFLVGATGERHLDAVLGRDPGHPFRILWFLGHRWCGPIPPRLSNLLEEALVQTSRRQAHEHLAHPLADVPMGVAVAPGNVEEGACPPAPNAALSK